MTEPSPPCKRGRPKTGKKKDPKYTLASGFVLKTTNDTARHFLIDNDEFKDMGDLLDSAIVEFLSKRNYVGRKKNQKSNP